MSRNYLFYYFQEINKASVRNRGRERMGQRQVSLHLSSKVLTAQRYQTSLSLLRSTSCRVGASVLDAAEDLEDVDLELGSPQAAAVSISVLKLWNSNWAAPKPPMPQFNCQFTCP